MRIEAILTSVALALVPAAVSAGQDDYTPPLRNRGEISFGVRGSSLDGDSARFERVRDLGDGLFLQTLRVDREQNGWFYQLAGDNVGRRDQRLFALASKPGRIRFWGEWNQTPLVLSRTAETFYQDTGGTDLRVPPAVQQAGGDVDLLPTLGRVFDLKSRRDTAAGGVRYLPTEDVTFRLNISHTKREGTNVYGTSWGHASFAEVPAPVQHSLTDIDGSAEYAGDRALYRVGYTLSWFNNDARVLTWDNPFLAASLPGLSSVGRTSGPQSNTWFTVTGMASYRLPRRTRVTASVSTGLLKDTGEPIVPMHANTTLPVVALPRNTVDGRARTKGVNLVFTTRPTALVDVDVRYKFYNYDSQTPAFTLTERVPYDNSIGAVEDELHSPVTFDIQRQTLDADVRLSPAGVWTAGAGLSVVREDRQHRLFDSTTDTTLRLVFDTVGNQWVTVRTKYEHAQRRGDGIEEGVAELIAAEEQPLLRRFDVADRDRDRVTVIGTIMPAPNLSLQLSAVAGQEYYGDWPFGLQDNTHRAYSFGADAAPSEFVSLGASYAYERYETHAKSRSASAPPPNATFFDARRDWTVDTADRGHSFLANAEVREIGFRLDLSGDFDLNRVRTRYLYALPADTTLDIEGQLPGVLSETRRGRVNALYRVSERIRLGFGYLYEAYRVQDFGLDAESNPSLARSGGLILGYLLRPYTAHVFSGRFVYGW